MDETKDGMVSKEATETDPDSDARNKATRKHNDTSKHLHMVLDHKLDPLDKAPRQAFYTLILEMAQRVFVKAHRAWCRNKVFFEPPRFKHILSFVACKPFVSLRSQGMYSI